MARAAKKQSVIDEVSGVFDEAVDQAESAVNRGWEVAFEILPERAEKLVRDLTKQSRKVSSDLDKRRKKVVKRLEKAVSGFDKQGQRFAKRAERRLDGVLNAVERRVQGAVETVERNVAGVVRPVAKRLDLASQSEVANLKRRLTQVEKRLGSKTAKATTHKSAPRSKTTRRAA